MPIRHNHFSKESLAKEEAKWFSTSELLEYLGISKLELQEQFALFKEGIHYKYNTIENSDKQILWRIDLIDELLCLPIAPLEREAMNNAIKNKITCNK